MTDNYWLLWGIAGVVWGIATYFAVGRLIRSKAMLRSGDPVSALRTLKKASAFLIVATIAVSVMLYSSFARFFVDAQ